MFTQTVEYALRAVVHLAGQKDSPSTTQEIARATKVPQAYLSKVVQALSRAGIVRSHRGIGGGITLARPAEELTILEVVNAVDPIQRIKKCPLDLAEHQTRLCPLHKRMDKVLAMAEATLGHTTLAEVLERRDR